MRFARRASACFGAGAVAVASHTFACGDGLPAPKRTVESARYVVAWHTLPAPPIVGEHFVVDLAVCPKPGAKRPADVRVGATMPDHRHGMNYRPTVTPQAGERYRAQGMMFHMPGRWVIEFELIGEGTTDRVMAEMVLK
jgi:hypothetical protein